MAVIVSAISIRRGPLPKHHPKPTAICNGDRGAVARGGTSCFQDGAPAKALLFFEAQDVSDDVVPLIGLKNEVRHGAMGSLEENI
jgi:hypothetical protein